MELEDFSPRQQVSGGTPPGAKVIPCTLLRPESVPPADHERISQDRCRTVLAHPEQGRWPAVVADGS